MLTILGSIAVSIMMLSYALESRSKWYVLIFAGASAATSVYSAFAGVYPITVIEAIWALIALRRFGARHRAERAATKPALGTPGQQMLTSGCR